MNTRLEGEERVLKISPFTLKKMAIATQNWQTCDPLKCPQVNVDISQIKFEFGMLVGFRGKEKPEFPEKN